MQQTEPLPHWAELVQAWHSFPVQTRPAQVAVVQQSPRLQPPLQHRNPAGHSASSWQLLQLLLVQVAPAGQSGFWQQSPVTQRPEQQRLPPPHCWSVVQSEHCLLRHAWPPPHSAFEQH